MKNPLYTGDANACRPCGVAFPSGKPASCYLTEADFINAGYSPARAREFARSTAHNWKTRKVRS